MPLRISKVLELQAKQVKGEELCALNATDRHRGQKCQNPEKRERGRLSLDGTAGARAPNHLAAWLADAIVRFDAEPIIQSKSDKDGGQYI